MGCHRWRTALFVLMAGLSVASVDSFGYGGRSRTARPHWMRPFYYGLVQQGAPRFGPRTMYGDEFTGPQLRMLRSLAASPAAVVTSREAAVEEEPGSDQEEQDDLAMENDDNGGVGGGSKREFYGVRRNKMPQGFRFSANPWLIKQQFRKPPQMSPNFKKKKLKLIY